MIKKIMTARELVARAAKANLANTLYVKGGWGQLATAKKTRTGDPGKEPRATALLYLRRTAFDHVVPYSSRVGTHFEESDMS